MPKTKLQDIFFTALMAFVMVYAMICYNISLEKSGLSNELLPPGRQMGGCLHPGGCPVPWRTSVVMVVVTLVKT